LARVFLAINALVWFPYGLLCFIAPGTLERFAGLTASSTTAVIEVRAMYGGLEMAIGALAAAAALRASLRRPALIALAFLASGLFTTRALATLWAAELSEYTAGALLLEVVLAAVSIRLLAVDTGAGT